MITTWNYDYLLGGKDNFAADREPGEQALAAYPNLVYSVRANRAFLAGAVRFPAAEMGIRQFLYVGTGMPTAGRFRASGCLPASRTMVGIRRQPG